MKIHEINTLSYGLAHTLLCNAINQHFRSVIINSLNILDDAMCSFAGEQRTWKNVILRIAWCTVTITTTTTILISLCDWAWQMIASGRGWFFFSFYIQMEFQMLSRLFINQHYHLMTLHKALFFEYLLVSWFHNMFLLRLLNIRLLPMWKIFSDLTCDPIIMKRLRVIPYSILTSSFSWQKCIRRREAAECVWAQFDFCLPLLSAEKWTIRLR